MNSERRNNYDSIPIFSGKDSNANNYDAQLPSQWSSGAFKQSISSPHKNWNDNSKSHEIIGQLGNISNSFRDRRSFQMEQSQVIKVQPEILQRKLLKIVKRQEKQCKVPIQQDEWSKQKYTNYGYRFYKTSFYDLLYKITGILIQKSVQQQRDAYTKIYNFSQNKHKIEPSSYKHQPVQDQYMSENRNYIFQGSPQPSQRYNPPKNQYYQKFRKSQENIRKNSNLMFGSQPLNIKHNSNTKSKIYNLYAQKQIIEDFDNQDSMIFPSFQLLQSSYENPLKTKIPNLQQEQSKPIILYHLNPHPLIDCIPDISLHFPIDLNMEFIGNLQELLINKKKEQAINKKKAAEISTADNINSSHKIINTDKNLQNGFKNRKIRSFHNEQSLQNQYSIRQTSRLPTDKRIHNEYSSRYQKNQNLTTISHNPAFQIKAAMDRNKSIILKDKIRPKSLTSVNFSYGKDHTLSPSQTHLNITNTKQLKPNESNSNRQYKFFHKPIINRNVRPNSLQTNNLQRNYCTAISNKKNNLIDNQYFDVTPKYSMPTYYPCVSVSPPPIQRFQTPNQYTNCINPSKNDGMINSYSHNRIIQNSVGNPSIYRTGLSLSPPYSNYIKKI